MYIYRIKMNLACKVKVEHVEFYVTRYLREVSSTGCFTGCTLEMDPDNNIILIEQKCTNLGKYQDYLEHHEEMLLNQISSNIGKDLVNLEKTLTQIVCKLDSTSKN